MTPIAAGLVHSLALLTDGTVWAWGGDFQGQLGIGAVLWRSYPVQVRWLDSVANVSAIYQCSWGKLRRKGTG